MAHVDPKEFKFNYSKVTPTVFFGSSMSKPDDVETLIKEGVQVLLSVQEPEDEQQFGIPVPDIHAKFEQESGRIQHVWAPSPEATPELIIAGVGKLLKATKGDPNTVVYTHCTGGGGRGPTFGCAYMIWAHPVSLEDAVKQGTAVRKIRVKTDAIVAATRQLLGDESVDVMHQPLTEEQRKTILDKLMGM